MTTIASGSVAELSSLNLKKVVTYIISIKFLIISTLLLVDLYVMAVMVAR